VRAVLAVVRLLEAGTQDHARCGLEAPILAAAAVFTMADPTGGDRSCPAASGSGELVTVAGRG
jgi:hypothetical protein